jgi:hypothetical protein
MKKKCQNQNVSISKYEELGSNQHLDNLGNSAKCFKTSESKSDN